ncbi:MAG: hypothetical protein LBM77_10255 [Spirochaetaceae bacterium]|jgi:chromosome segregation ATPase|nr:hypothetical protein [Spirochaetaceae bacterium]
MDERNKSIKELEARKKEALDSVLQLQQTLGTSLLPKAADGDSNPTVESWKASSKEIDECQAAIATAQSDIEKLKRLEGEIAAGEEEQQGRLGKIPDLYAGLGELVLNDDVFERFSAVYQGQLDELVSKIHSLEDKINEKNGNQANILTLIGQNAQGMVLKSFLKKNNANLTKLYREAGEKFVAEVPGFGEVNDSINDILDEIDWINKTNADSRVTVNSLRDERRDLLESYAAIGGPKKKIDACEKEIAGLQTKITAFCKDYGAEIEAKGIKASVLSADEKQILKNLEDCRSTIADYEKRIAKLQREIAIDEEKSKIRKMEESIADYKKQISAAKEAISNLEHQIQDSNTKIDTLTAENQQSE